MLGGNTEGGPRPAGHSLYRGVRAVHDHAEVLQGHLRVLLHHHEAGALAAAQGLVLALEGGDLRLGAGGGEVACEGFDGDAERPKGSLSKTKHGPSARVTEGLAPTPGS